MVTSIQERSANLVRQVYSEGYYTERFNKVAASYKMSAESIAKHMHEDKYLVAMWNDFWFALPDSPGIRHGAFFPLCDLCEETFNEPDDES
jgi:hypothetical protein